MSEDTDTKASTSESDDSADAAGVKEAGFESNNNSREETEAIMEADSPDDIDQDLLKEIEEERKERLDPDNRPENAEVDNTQRTFIPEEARFEDSDLPDDAKDDGIGQKEPDPETQAGSSDDKVDESEGEAGGESDGEAEQEAAESDASTDPEPTQGEPAEAGRHKA